MELHRAMKIKICPYISSRSNLASRRDEVPADIEAVSFFQVGSDWMDSNQILLLLFFSVKLFDFEVIDEPV